MPEKAIAAPGRRTVLAFDFGLRRIGVAVGQELLGSARPVTMIPARDGIPDWDRIGAVLTEWCPDLVVVGLPLNMDGTESDICARARKFGKRIHGRFHVPVEMMDERLSSFEAKEAVLASGGSSDFGRHGVDDLAAVLILESWFNHQQTHPDN
ncbi:putative holliday junction resolvase [Marinobacter daqiaonensis]|uniref:Putative pre-16S rRNA nuclease n=1 Tax=Marinobacter daqiaonensis TaxID=650891 RepID=A0A1I6I8R6_9GAMM|nr:Holliday junction resolvase RuvX [Marinobacter daqiaonensis]SFR63038.1 putative holliday junction resolvase [Marinobacter daqiaonensis]